VILEWTDDLATGSELIDKQHKELFKRINSLLEACRQGKGKSEINGLMQFLDDYVITHFSEEEQYMQKYAYPGYAKHKAEHLQFIIDFRKLKNEFENDGPDFYLVMRTKEMVVRWLLDHIRKVDRALGDFQKRTTGT
jgi:hemerythrin